MEMLTKTTKALERLTAPPKVVCRLKIPRPYSCNWHSSLPRVANGPGTQSSASMSCKCSGLGALTRNRLRCFRNLVTHSPVQETSHCPDLHWCTFRYTNESDGEFTNDVLEEAIESHIRDFCHTIRVDVSTFRILNVSASAPSDARGAASLVSRCARVKSYVSTLALINFSTSIARCGCQRLRFCG